ncbi:DUF1611 domain-containing protein [Novosphingobium sp. G106]|uniref:DUF1611 domain-containing protein n=1 Tax=Novosphingobium sp. G106 TaxID=2849500 RepID=UPI001C2DB229|nr:DUF1611 domain-containing protein [Novosphingobium sp. G106]MBV1687742.1 DUF1611 domain-containing protein [Novosphingobium sp. G106]
MLVSTAPFVATSLTPANLVRSVTNSLPDTPTAIVYCEGNFGEIDGKTANGLVRHSEKYSILSVIDSRKVGADTGMILDSVPNGIPICRDLADAVAKASGIPSAFIYGAAPITGMLSPEERGIVLEAMALGMNIVNGLHEFLSEDPEFVAAAAAGGVTIVDIRKPRDKKHLRLFTGRINDIACPRIAVLGTDCAIGKRTTATILARALNERGIKAVMIGTGQTGLIQGARYGLALDAVPSQFCAGELEATILDAYENEDPDIIIVEGQGALSHPAFSTSSFILRGSVPDGVILQHAPARQHRCDFPMMAMPEPAREISLIENFAETRVIGLTINHENMSPAKIEIAINRYEKELGIPVTDALARSPDELVAMVLAAFPQIARECIAAAA